MRKSFILAAGVLAAPATAGTVSITIPTRTVAEYHKPYLAAWIEPAGGGTARTLAIWYDVKKKGNEPGTKWLADLRSWWRKGGRTMTLPADGVSGQTRTPGTYTIPLPADLKPGAYTLSVEATRENGGRELVSVPLKVPVANASASGKTELGAITLSSR